MKLRVLVADPSPFLRLAVRRALAADGMAVAEVVSADEALARAARDRHDAVLLDRDLDPEMTATAQIATVMGAGALIVLSADVSVTAALAAVRAGACGFLPKDTPPGRL